MYFLMSMAAMPTSVRSLRTRRERRRFIKYLLLHKPSPMMGGCGIVSFGLPVIRSDQTDKIAGQTVYFADLKLHATFEGVISSITNRETSPVGSQSRDA